MDNYDFIEPFSFSGPNFCQQKAAVQLHSCSLFGITICESNILRFSAFSVLSFFPLQEHCTGSGKHQGKPEGAVCTSSPSPGLRQHHPRGILHLNLPGIRFLTGSCLLRHGSVFRTFCCSDTVCADCDVNCSVRQNIPRRCHCLNEPIVTDRQCAERQDTGFSGGAGDKRRLSVVWFSGDIIVVCRLIEGKPGTGGYDRIIQVRLQNSAQSLPLSSVHFSGYSRCDSVSIRQNLRFSPSATKY